MTTCQQDEILAGLKEPLRCECAHDTPLGVTQQCPEKATRRVVLVCAAEGCTNAAEVYLLCRPCADSWRREMPRRRIRVSRL